jgi:hypothetical protein
MEPIKNTVCLDLELEIEELEPKIAPASGETVIPLPRPGGPRR